MKIASGVRQYNTQQDYLNKNYPPVEEVETESEGQKERIQKKKARSISPAVKVQLSKRAKELSIAKPR
ncbi:MAG: hypothetical protein OXB84_03905 [Halobacteriovoraceae bacterium]|nr:hypothetical protein [Halobacteriovoraceae bacterium]